MAISVDTTRPFLRPSELTALVEAVHGADVHDEHSWIEWKSTLDLATQHGTKHLAKALVGLANRDPASANRWAGGHGYFVVGVEPGAAPGVQPVDAAELTGRVQAVVGHALRWSPEYLKRGAVDVLVVIVDPPRPGDPIHCIQKQIENFQPGTIFARHHGKTMPATPADLGMLQARLLARTSTLQLIVGAAEPTVECPADLGSAIDEWVMRRRRSLMRFTQDPSPSLNGLIDKLAREEGALSQISAITAGAVIPDSRTHEQYEDEVKAYIESARKVLVDRGLWRLFRHEPASLVVEVRNPSDIGYEAVRLVVHVAGDVSSFDQLGKIVRGDFPPLPVEPRPLGTAIRVSELADKVSWHGMMPADRPVVLSRLSAASLNEPPFTVTDTGSVDIAFHEFDLRPGDSLKLPPVPLVLQEPPGSVLTARWHATGAGVRGRPIGEFEIVTKASSIDLTAVLAKTSDNKHR